MSDIENQDINEKIQIISRQTDLSEPEIIERLKTYNNDHILVIKSYFGITNVTEKNVTSINQEIYKQLRYKLQNHK
jgi:hypothetical protein